MTNGLPIIRITSFGYLHAAPPAAHLTIDVRRHFRDPHIDPRMRELTCHDRLVRETVMNTPGIRELVAATIATVDAYTAGPSGHGTSVAVGCAGGRHRAATVAMAMAAVLSADLATADEFGLLVLSADRCRRTVLLTHRDLHKPVTRSVASR